MDRVTVNMIQEIIKDLHLITGLNYKHDTVMRWHTLYCDNSRICTANTKKQFFDQLTAIKAQLYTLERTGILTKR